MLSSPRKVSFAIALLVSVVTAVVAIIAYKFSKLLFVPFVVLVAVIEFISIYLLVHNWLFNVIFKKINPLYRTIQANNLSDLELRDKVYQQQSIENINAEVLNWARTRANEIAELK
jgi:hypothetical protein